MNEGSYLHNDRKDNWMNLEDESETIYPSSSISTYYHRVRKQTPENYFEKPPHPMFKSDGGFVGSKCTGTTKKEANGSNEFVEREVIIVGNGQYILRKSKYPGFFKLTMDSR